MKLDFVDSPIGEWKWVEVWANGHYLGSIDLTPGSYEYNFFPTDTNGNSYWAVWALREIADKVDELNKNENR